VISLLREPPATAGSVQALELRGIAHRFGGGWVLRGCDLRLPRGQAVALVGDNGSGKTTLLRIASTLLRPSRGDGSVLGADLRRAPGAVRERVGVVGFRAGVYEDLTAAENLEFAMRMHGIPAAAGEIGRVLGEVGLARRADELVRGFSAGMRRRLALARVLLRPPELLLLDEPYAALDEDGIALVNRMVTGVAERGGGVLLATHDVARADGVVHRTVRLAGGRLHEVPAAEPLELARVGDRGWG
jgi:heme exporter protein A